MWGRATKMWGLASASKIAEDEDNFLGIHQSFSVNEEYLHAFRTRSYVDFFTKAHLLVDEPSGSPRSSMNTMDILLEPEQHLVPYILEAFSKQSSDLKLLMLRHFDTSAQVQRICSKLLGGNNTTHANYRLIQRALQRFSHYSPEHHSSAISKLGSFSLLRDPFSDLNPERFKLICNNISSILHCLKSKRKKVSRRIKLIEFIKKASGFCFTVACSVFALVAIGIAAHSTSGLVMGPAPLRDSPIQLKKKFWSRLNCFKCKSLMKLRKLLDVVAKGTCTLSRDFDTVSRIAARFHDEVEHKKEKIRFCLERREDKFPLEEVVKDLRKNGLGFKWPVEELEEHVCLCLVTINRARVFVIKEMSKP